MHELPNKLLPDAVDEMIETRARDGTSKAYVKVLRVYLTSLKERFHCQLRSVTSGQLSDHLRGLEVSPRSKNNMSKQIGWLVEATNAGLRKAAEKAGKDPEKVKPVKGEKNALRHSFISYRVAEIQNVAQVGLEAGNSPQVVFSNCRELVRPADAKVWFSIVPDTQTA